MLLGQHATRLYLLLYDCFQLSVRFSKEDVSVTYMQTLFTLAENKLISNTNVP